MNSTHLNALELRLSHERNYLAKAASESERALRRVWIQQIEKEISAEQKFLGMSGELPALSDDELLAELT